MCGRLQIIALVFGLPLFGGSVPGIRNFDQVDAKVYRGGQPTVEGFQYLAGLGVKTIIDLREAGDRSRDEAKAVAGAGMQYVSVPMSGLAPPTDAEITQILAMLEHPVAGPVFVHCMRGADRTGVVIAAYHIDHDKWENSRALRDAKAHKMGFFQLPRENYIKTFRPRAVDATVPLAGATAISASRD